MDPTEGAAASEAAADAARGTDEAAARATEAARSVDESANRSLDEINANLRLVHTRLGELMDKFDNHAHEPIEVQAHIADAEEAVEEAAEHTEAAAGQAATETARTEQVAAPQVTVPAAPAKRERYGLYRHARGRG